MKDKEWNKRESYSFSKRNKIFSSIGDIGKPNISRNNSSDKVKIIKQKLGNFNKVYTPICQKLYPLIIKKNIYERAKKFSYFCLTCNIHLLDKSKNEHKEHSIISLKEIEIMDEDIISMEKMMEIKMDNLFKSLSQEKADNPEVKLQIENRILKLKNEFENFFHSVIEQYKYNKYNFYNFFNFYYLYKLKDDIKNVKNDLLRKFFSVHSFKKLCHTISYFVESKKKIWLLRNLIKYKKYQINKAKLKLRAKAYKFETLGVLLKDEGFDDSKINKMNEIIKEVEKHKREDLKKKIFIFMINSIDVFKKNPQKFLKELDIILVQVKINFKQMVKDVVGDTEDVKKFSEQENSSFYYKNNDKNNKIVNNYKESIQNNVYNNEHKNYIIKNGKKSENKNNKKSKEQELYNDFKVKEYEPRNQSFNLDLSNTFIANNNNNNYYETNKNYTSKNNIYSKRLEENQIIDSENDNEDDESEKPKRIDLLRRLANVNKNHEIKNTVNIDVSNIISANNNNNNVEKNKYIEVYENNKIEEKTVINYHHEKYEKKIPDKKEQKNNEFNECDILKKELNKKDLVQQNDKLYTSNYKFDIQKVNNNNNQKTESNHEYIVKNSDIKQNNEINIYDKSVIQCEDENIEIKYDKKNENNNKEKKEDHKLDIENKEVNIDTKTKIIKGDLVTKIDMDVKAEIKDKEKNNKNKSKEEEERKRKSDFGRKTNENEGKNKQENNKKREDEKKRKIKEEGNRYYNRKVNFESGNKDRVCNNCFKVCHHGCKVNQNIHCVVYNKADRDKCKKCGCNLKYHSLGYLNYDYYPNGEEGLTQVFSITQ